MESRVFCLEMGRLLAGKVKGWRLRGFSLIELLVVIGLLGSVGLVIVTVFLRTLRVSGKGRVMERVEGEAGFAMERVMAVAREAKSVTVGGVDCRNPGNPGAPVECEGDCSWAIESISRETVRFDCVDVGGSDGRIEELVGGGTVRLTGEQVRVAACSVKCLKASFFEPGVLTVAMTLAMRGNLVRAEQGAEITVVQSVVMGNF